MLKTISASELRANIRHVLNEVNYSRIEYLIEKFGEPTAAIISMEDFHFLQAARQQAAAAPGETTVAGENSA